MFPSKLLAPTVTLVTIIVVGAGLYVSGSPMQARRERFDTQRINELQQISYAVDNFWLTKQRLPKNLDELREGMNTPPSSYYLNSIKDPKSGTDYEFRAKESATGTYELCSTFETDSNETTKQGRSIYTTYPTTDAPFWHHAIGRTCFSLQVRTINQKLPPM